MCARQHRSRLGQLTFHAPAGFTIGATFPVRSGAMARAKRDDDVPDGWFFPTALVVQRPPMLQVIPAQPSGVRPMSHGPQFSDPADP